jgi:hypothetical protein
MTELMTMIALVSVLAAMAAGWYLWRLLAWHPHGGLTPARITAEPITWRVPEHRSESDPMPVALTRSARQETAAPAGTRPDPLNRRANAGRWSSDAAGNGPATGFHRVNGSVPDRHPTTDEQTAAGEAKPVSREQLRLALRAVLVHTPQRWPGGVYCSSDRSPFPCRMRHWGEEVLLAAGWDADGIDAMARQTDAGIPPWLTAGAGDATPPR